MGETIKLNLGCGPKILDGWVNVDLDPRADVHADLRELPFDDSYADVIQAIHVIEHFYAWDVHKVLKEWMRVLKPGGEIILECPDILKCARNIVAAAERGEIANPRLSIWGLYGDPGYRSELMLHKWGYLPETLMGELTSVGFVDVREETPQTHMKTLRDLRVTGVKP